MNKNSFLQYKKLSSILALLLLASALSACSGTISQHLSPYKIDIRQGNFLTLAMVDKVKPGMSRDEVAFVLGTPLLTSVFHANRWEYYYNFQPGVGAAEQRRVIVFFKDNVVDSVEGNMADKAKWNVPVPAQTRVIEITQPILKDK